MEGFDKFVTLKNEIEFLRENNVYERISNFYSIDPESKGNENTMYPYMRRTIPWKLECETLGWTRDYALKRVSKSFKLFPGQYLMDASEKEAD